ncbi:SpaH/EbpB family LPXTG-anchored major pilin [Corynebacterium cystitidis]|uniref:SpaH/EbpB family LPXTG-anchored major pilin n=1 Tax=Corynebacterium cystitidis TaxID=35757 RepID=UPI00211DD181|nr:SpaH/EbpB family LPXTG-anchored major pilin [Corynebacterium cystitidis]
MNKFKRGLVVAISTGLVITGGAAMGPAMVAAQGFQDTVETLPTQDTAKLTIHKLAKPDTSLPHDGRKVDTTGLTPLKGAKFEVTQVQGIDLQTNAGWREAAGLTVETAKGRLDASTKKVVTTEGDHGSVTLDNLPVGLYLVEEIEAPFNYNVTVEPFLVTLPLTNPENRGEWLYDVHVYPKNEKVDQDLPRKTVKDANMNASKGADDKNIDEDNFSVGDRITYSITAPIAAYDKVTAVHVRDVYTSGRLESAEVANVALNGAALDEADYAFNGAVDGVADLALTASGLKKVNDLPVEDRKLTYDLSFAVKAVEGGALSSIDNALELRQSNQTDKAPDPSNPTEPPTDTPPVTPPGTPPGTPPLTPGNPGPDPLTRSYFGNVTLKKLNVKDDKPVPGATFEIYRCNNAAELKDAIKDSTAPDPIRRQTTDSNGVINFLGLHANDFEDNEAKESNPTGYCLVEDQAADSFELLAEPVFFQVKADTVNHKVDLVEIATDEVKNTPTFGLPHTGGAGVWMILGAGLLLLITASGYFVFRQRQA